MQILIFTLLVFQICGCMAYPEVNKRELIDLQRVPEARLIESGYRDDGYAVCGFEDGQPMPYNCKQEIVRRHPDWPTAFRQAIEGGKIMQGMTKHQVLAAWTWPSSIKLRKSFWGKEEQWTNQDEGKYLYFRNGKLIEWLEQEKLEFYDIPDIETDPKSILIPEIFEKGF